MKKFILVPTLAVAMVSAGVIAAGSIRISSRAPITRAELDGINGETVYEAITVLRPSWIDPHDDPADIPTAFIEIRCADTECLRWIGVEQADEIRFVSAHEATASSFQTHADAIRVALRPSASSVSAPDRSP